MAIHFHTLKVKEVKKETADCISVIFLIPAELKKTFDFKQGQNVTVKKNIEGEEIRRSYSICSAPYENELRIAIKRVEDGKFSCFANTTLKPGDELDVLPPTGKFHTALQSTNQKKYLALAAGSGITPILSIIKTTLKEEPESYFTLVYGNQTRKSIIFFEELEAIKNRYLQRFNFINILSREKTDASVHSGRINTEKLVELSKFIDYKKTDEFFICGPEEMIFSVKAYLEALGIAKQKIHFELFTTPGQKKIIPLNQQQKVSTGSTSRVSIQLDGRSFDFDLGFNGNNILDAALEQGADLPYACKGGVCCTCKAKLLEGEVEMEANWGLEQEEIEQGFILTCQSHPTTEKVVIDFDIK